MLEFESGSNEPLCAIWFKKLYILMRYDFPMIMEDKGGCVWNAACENFFEKKYRAVIENSFCFLQAGLRSRGGEEPAPRACGCRTTLRVGSAWNISAFRGAGRTLVVQANRLGGGTDVPRRGPCAEWAGAWRKGRPVA